MISVFTHCIRHRLKDTENEKVRAGWLRKYKLKNSLHGVSIFTGINALNLQCIEHETAVYSVCCFQHMLMILFLNKPLYIVMSVHTYI